MGAVVRLPRLDGECSPRMCLHERSKTPYTHPWSPLPMPAGTDRTQAARYHSDTDADRTWTSQREKRHYPRPVRLLVVARDCSNKHSGGLECYTFLAEKHFGNGATGKWTQVQHTCVRVGGGRP
eukprot:gene22757-biopygen20771